MKRGEQAFLDWIAGRAARPGDLTVPVGDDAAVFRVPSGHEAVVTTDAIAEGSHFLKSDPPRLVGRKALAVSLSDAAAMGASPRFAFVAATLPRGFGPELPRELTRGMAALAAKHGVVLAGGDTISHRGGIVIAVTVVAFVRKGRAITRSGARIGDVIAVTGALGGSIRRGRHLRFEPRLRESRALVKLGPPTAMMDVSDGLLLDLWRLLRASGRGARIDAGCVPVHRDAGPAGGRRARESALSDGEDFELLFTMPRRRFEECARRWSLPVPIRAIGEVVASGFTIVEDGVERRARPRGFEHR
jgi:thiamine-monophosphate kinase